MSPLGVSVLLIVFCSWSRWSADQLPARVGWHEMPDEPQPDVASTLSVRRDFLNRGVSAAGGLQLNRVYLQQVSQQQHSCQAHMQTDHKASQSGLKQAVSNAAQAGAQ